MSKRAGLILSAAFAERFPTVDGDAYRGYFQDDEIDNLSWAPYLAPLDFLKGAVGRPPRAKCRQVLQRVQF